MFALLQTYVLKVMMDTHGLLSARLNEKYKREFDIFTELEPERKALRAVGKRDGLVRFYHSFTSKVPTALIAMVAAKFGEEYARVNCPPAARKIVFFECAIYSCFCSPVRMSVSVTTYGSNMHYFVVFTTVRLNVCMFLH